MTPTAQMTPSTSVNFRNAGTSLRRTLLATIRKNKPYESSSVSFFTGSSNSSV